MEWATVSTFAWGGETPLPTRLTLGLDLGKISDYTALAIVEERPERVNEQFNRAAVIPIWGDDPDFTVPWLKRWPLHTAYHDIAKEVAALVAQLAGRAGTEIALCVDATGVGVAVLEILLAQDAIATLANASGFRAITITAGDQVTDEYQYSSPHRCSYRSYHVPKKDLVGLAQAALQRQKIKVSDQLAEAAALMKELREFEYAMTESANLVYRGGKGSHDDLVLACAIGLWGSRQRPAIAYTSNYRTSNDRGDIPPYGTGVRPYGQRR